MAEWIDVGAASAIAPGAPLASEFDGYAVTIVRVAGTLYAFEDRCTHDDGPLADAPIEGTQIICPRHGARFCLRTGEALTPPAYEPLRIFAVREHDGRVQLRATAL
jgi:3-phenylpropionate/trans-cinnamate dioxygenase ferredoxin component